MKTFCYAQQYGRPRLPRHISHAIFLIFFIVIALEIVRATPLEGGLDFSRTVGVPGVKKLETATSLSKEGGNIARQEAQYLHETHDHEYLAPKAPERLTFTSSNEMDDEKNPSISEKANHGGPSGSPNSAHQLEPGPLPNESADTRNRGWFLSLFVRFWKSLTKSWATPKRGGPKLPIKDHLKDPMKGVWHNSATFRYSPRPPTDRDEEEITTLEMLGKALSNPDQAAARRAANEWVEKLTEKKAVPLRREVLSTELFFQLVKNYRAQAVLAKQYQEWIRKMGENLVEVFGGERYLKDLFKEIEAKFKEFNHGLIGTKYDLEFYAKPLSPLLLLVEEDGKSFQNFFVKKSNVLTGTFRETGISKMEYLDQEATKYKKYVQHFKETMDTQDALKHYLEESRKLNVGHQAYAEQVLHHFNNLDRSTDANYLENINHLQFDSDAVQNLMGKFGPSNHEVL